jgi:hypothetical protein
VWGTRLGSSGHGFSHADTPVATDSSNLPKAGVEPQAERQKILPPLDPLRNSVAMHLQVAALPLRDRLRQ